MLQGIKIYISLGVGNNSCQSALVTRLHRSLSNLRTTLKYCLGISIPFRFNIMKNIYFVQNILFLIISKILLKFDDTCTMFCIKTV